MHMKLKEIRKQKQLTQEQLSNKSGVDQPTISKLERGIIHSTGWENVCRLAKALEVPPEELFPVKTNAA